MPLVISLIKTYSLGFVGGLHGLGLAVIHEGGEAVGVAAIAIQDTVDGVFAGDILDLPAAQLIGLRQDISITLTQTRHHTLPNATANFGIGLFKIDFLEETPLKGTVQIGGEVGCGDKDAVQIFHLL